VVVMPQVYTFVVARENGFMWRQPPSAVHRAQLDSPSPPSTLISEWRACPEPAKRAEGDLLVASTGAGVEQTLLSATFDLAFFLN